MISINNNYYLQIEVLTPLHVGAGNEKDWIENADFVFSNNKVYKLNQRKVLADIDDVDKYSELLISRKEGALLNSLSGKPEDFSDEVFDLDVTSNNEIKSFIRNGIYNKPFIPGSSIKGAIRSVLLNHFLNGDKNPGKIKILFGSPSKGDEFMRFIKVSDAQFERTSLVNTKIFNLKQDNSTKDFIGGWKHEFRNNTTTRFKPNGFNTIYEVIEPGDLGTCSLNITVENLYNKLHLEKLYDVELRKAYEIEDIKKKERKIKDIGCLKDTIPEKNKIISSSIQYLFDIINQQTKEYVRKEIAFFKKYNQAEKSENILSCYEKLLDIIIPNHSTSAIFRMSAGSGFHNITGDWQLNTHEINGVYNRQGQYNGKKSAKSRKIAIHNGEFLPMGFVKVSLISKAEYDEYERIKEGKLNKEQEKIAFEKAEQERKKQEAQIAEQARKEKEAEEKRRKAEEERIAAEQRIAEEKRLQEEREEQEKRNAQILKESQEKNRQKAEEERAVMLDKGLAALLQDIDEYDEGKDIIANYLKHLENIKEEDYPAVFNFLKRSYANASGGKKRWTRIKKSPWSLVKEWVGKETMEKWYDDLFNKK